MCEFCTKHGEGKKWYENIFNYTEELFNQVNSKEHFKKYLSNFYHGMTHDIPKAYAWKKRFPRIYRLIAYPMVTGHMKKTHFGQIVPIEDIEIVLNNFSSIVRLPCICRKVTTGENKRFCFGIGMDLTYIFKDVPDFSDFDTMTIEEAKKYLYKLDEEGNTHSLWTFNTPFIAALCNCDRDCMAYRFQVKMEIGKIMWKAEYAAEIDMSVCSGCKECMKRCYFGAIKYDMKNNKCSINLKNCFGCGICRNVCNNNAIKLKERIKIPQIANEW
ncbi:MAG: 4Fe-4S binding protein [Nitrospirae bacterium]|jgi:ferredoxin|nr:4Fe-4S binding protein [Nitrospirota bacterium]